MYGKKPSYTCTLVRIFENPFSLLTRKGGIAISILANYPDIMSVNDLRSALGIGRTKAYELIRSGEIRSIKVGKAIRIPKTILLDYVKGCGYNEDEADKRPYREGGKQ